ncbi:MAG: hypothetical protein IPM64_17720 [Phycisphaerales bacterium]|nr:hypothetical protein [Phycisphaerales bacterium]
MSDEDFRVLANAIRAQLRASTSGPEIALHVAALVLASFALDLTDHDKARAADLLDSFGRDLADDVRNAKVTVFVGPTLQ